MLPPTTVTHKNKPHDVYIGRPSLFGNPYSHKDDTIAKFQVESRAEAIQDFAEYFFQRFICDRDFRIAVLRLRGKVLGCWCRPLKCHGDIIAEFLNSL